MNAIDCLLLLERMEFVTIYTDKDKPSINEQLLSEGLAKTFSTRSEEARAENFGILVEKENEATQAKKGIHGQAPLASVSRVNELLGAENVQKAKAFEASLKRLEKCDGVVEHVFNGGRFKIRIPSVGRKEETCLNLRIVTQFCATIKAQFLQHCEIIL